MATTQNLEAITDTTEDIKEVQQLCRRIGEIPSGVETELISLIEQLLQSGSIRAILRRQDNDVTIPPKASPEVLAALHRGHVTREGLLAAEGGSVTARDFGPLVGLSHTAVNSRRNKGEILGVPLERGSYLIPVWQVKDGHILSGVPQTMAVLRSAGADSMAMQAFFLEAHDSLEGRRPLDVLRDGDLKAVLEAATTWGVHGAR
jgi:hypothetical protein